MFRPEVESGGKELWPNARFELLKVEVHRECGSCPTGVDSPGGGKEANMSESEPEPRRTVAERELVAYNLTDPDVEVKLTGADLLCALAIVEHVPHP